MDTLRSGYRPGIGGIRVSRVERKSGKECPEHRVISRYRFDGLFHTESVCQVDIFGFGTDCPTVILTELPTNPGISVTNAVERLATRIYREWFQPTGVNPKAIRWIDHYGRTPRFPEMWHEVTFDFALDAHEYGVPRWRRMARPEFWNALCG